MADTSEAPSLTEIEHAARRAGLALDPAALRDLAGVDAQVRRRAARVAEGLVWSDEPAVVFVMAGEDAR